MINVYITDAGIEIKGHAAVHNTVLGCSEPCARISTVADMIEHLLDDKIDERVKVSGHTILRFAKLTKSERITLDKCYEYIVALTSPEMYHRTIFVTDARKVEI